ncbi:MAG: TIGR00282 family metallophosphoesterase [Planctomycetota bacterium]|nr:TIGR00282 family metallophosphoesterase [Planctomycetota bacterium]
MFRILGVGDVVGRPGREVLQYFLPQLKAERGVDFVVVDAENAASGSGITEKIYRELRGYGADVITMGDHAYRRRESLHLYDKETRLLRPANWPSGAPGRGTCVVEGPRGVRVGVIHLQGRVFMSAQGDFFEEADRAIDAMASKADLIVVDMHAEASSEKVALSWYLDGRVAMIFGSHTHVPTADAIVRPKGTAYITDAGMTGPYNGVIGRVKEAVLKKMRLNVHEPFLVAEGDARLGAVIAEIDETTGRAVSCEGLWLSLPAGIEDA